MSLFNLKTMRIFNLGVANKKGKLIVFHQSDTVYTKFYETTVNKVGSQFKIPNNGKKIIEELDKADAHPYGARPFKRKNYIKKFITLTKDILPKKESDRFLKTVQNLKKLKSGQLNRLNIEVNKSKLKRNLRKAIF